MDMIVHVCTRPAWQAAVQQGEYLAASLETEGFIHASRPEQVLGVIERYYQHTPDLVLLWIDPEKISAEIRWEAAEAGIFPHIYGPLETSAVMRAQELHPDPDGIYRNLTD